MKSNYKDFKNHINSHFSVLLHCWFISVISQSAHRLSEREEFCILLPCVKLRHLFVTRTIVHSITCNEMCLVPDLSKNDNNKNN